MNRKKGMMGKFASVMAKSVGSSVKGKGAAPLSQKKDPLSRNKNKQEDPEAGGKRGGPVKNASMSFGPAAAMGTGDSANQYYKSALYDKLSDEELKEQFRARLRMGIPVTWYSGRGKRRQKKFVEIFTDNDGRTLKLKPMQGQDWENAIAHNQKLAAAGSSSLLSGVGKKAEREAKVQQLKAIQRMGEYRTVDIKDLWQADVEYGTLDKHTIIDWANGMSLDLEAVDRQEATFLQRGFDLILVDWTRNTSEYSDFWDSL